MKNQLKESSRCSNLQELRQEIIKLWTEKMERIQYLQNLVDSMPRRLQDVIEKEGEFTKYQIVLNYTLNLINFNFSIFSHFCKFERRFFVRPTKFVVANCTKV